MFIIKRQQKEKQKKRKRNTEYLTQSRILSPAEIAEKYILAQSRRVAQSDAQRNILRVIFRVLRVKTL